MRSDCFGALRAEDPEFYDKYYTPDGEPRWDVIIQNLEPATPEFKARRAETIRRSEERRRLERERLEKEERERRERGDDNNNNNPQNDSTGGDHAA
ncbi:MAG TPA: hypothetical protein VFE50_11330 [Cyclobacteriaceae bacterium]|nr:hypothetical protein [Cyclobacteriaceae bacterium]